MNADLDERERQIQHVREQGELERLVKRRAWQEKHAAERLAAWHKEQVPGLAAMGLCRMTIARRLGLTPGAVRAILREERLTRPAWPWPREHGPVASAWRVAHGLPAAIYVSGNELRRLKREAIPWPWPTGRPESWTVRP